MQKISEKITIDVTERWVADKMILDVIDAIIERQNMIVKALKLLPIAEGEAVKYLIESLQD